jgi:hypothetical protein
MMGRQMPLGMNRRSGLGAILLAAQVICASVCGAATPNLFNPDTMNHVVADLRTGVALFGYDPVAYHLDNQARQGLPDFEIILNDRIWRFTSAANKAAFEADPAVFMPLFGGHDGASVSEGVLIKGDPQLFVIAAGQLVLFRDQANRDRFAQEQIIRQRARENWPSVVRQQAGH